MGHKRALIAATLLATGASSVFNQDVADFSEELRENVLDEEPAAPPKRVQRTSERPASGAGGLVTAALKVKDVRIFGKDRDNYAVMLVGDGNEYTTKNEKLARELGGFKGTDHLVKIAYVDNASAGKIYHNIKSFEVTGLRGDEPTSPPPATTPPPTAGEIPFGR
jgi:hypothetical protein